MASSTVGRGTAVVALTLAGLAATAAPAGAAAGPTSTAPHALARPAVTAHPGPASTVVGWSPPSDDGGAPITGYTATATDHTDAARGHQTCVVGTVTGVTASTPAYTGPDSCVVRGLTPGDTLHLHRDRHERWWAPARPSAPSTAGGADRHGRSGSRLLAGRAPTAASSPSGRPGSTARPAALPLQRPVVGIVADRRPAAATGWWPRTAGVFAFGDAGFYGSIPGSGISPAGLGPGPRLNAPIVAIVPSTDGGGYFMVASDGGVFAFGDATLRRVVPGHRRLHRGGAWPSCPTPPAAATGW